MSWFHNRFVLPLAERERHAGLVRRMRAIRRFERLTEKEQRDEQQQRLRRLLQHAYDTVPYQRKRFDDAGFQPRDARVDRPLPLPALCRDDLRDTGHSLLSTAYKVEDLRRASSSGTTSTPVQFYRDIEGLRNKSALQLQLHSSVGYDTGDSVLTLWGAHRDLVLQPNWRWRLYEEGIIRRFSAPSGVLSEEILERFRIRYEKHRPKVLYCYASVLAAFATYLRQHGFQHRPEILVTTAEVLSDSNRALIESVFGVPVHNFYGSRDIGMIGAECSAHSGTHFHAWGSYVEFEPIGDTPDGSTYRLLVTDLLNYGQPFIRYDTGDCVTLAQGTCACGRWFPRASKILGRIGDGIVLADGSMVPAVSVGNHISQIGQSFRAIAKMQFVQKTHDHLHLRYVVKDNHPSAENELQTIRDAIDSLAARQMHWTMEKVLDIPREQSGKVRLCVSELSPPV
ncbi:MAG: hypothetical protein WA708_04110 [Acidobacteriaceae bacterium]